MKLAEIIANVVAGKTVCWRADNYIVKNWGTTLEPNCCIVCTTNNHGTGLTWLDGITMNEKEEDFYIKD